MTALSRDQLRELSPDATRAVREMRARTDTRAIGTRSPPAWRCSPRTAAPWPDVRQARLYKQQSRRPRVKPTALPYPHAVQVWE
jgi:hypothetical protein